MTFDDVRDALESAMEVPATVLEAAVAKAAELAVITVAQGTADGRLLLPRQEGLLRIGLNALSVARQTGICPATLALLPRPKLQLEALFGVCTREPRWPACCSDFSTAMTPRCARWQQITPRMPMSGRHCSRPLARLVSRPVRTNSPGSIWPFGGGWAPQRCAWNGRPVSVGHCRRAGARAAYLPAILGADAEFDTREHAAYVAELLVYRLGSIERGLTVSGDVEPLGQRKCRGVGRFVMAQGYLTCVQSHEKAWLPLLSRRYLVEPLIASLVMLVTDDDEPPQKPLTDTEQSELIGTLPLVISGSWSFWRDENHPPLRVPRAPTAEIARNDPCPCGSGENHNRCCGAVA